jgi:hypothetical protein
VEEAVEGVITGELVGWQQWYYEKRGAELGVVLK